MRFHVDAALPHDFTLEKFKAVVEAKGYRWVHQIPRGEKQLHEEIWACEDEGKGAIRYVYDHFVDVHWTRAESDIAGQPGEILHGLISAFPQLTTKELLGLASSTDLGTRSYAINALAVVTPIYRADVFNAIRDALFDQEPRLRGAAMKSIARWPYFKFARELDRLAETESVEALRDEAATLAKDLREHGRRGLS